MIPLYSPALLRDKALSFVWLAGKRFMVSLYANIGGNARAGRGAAYPSQNPTTLGAAAPHRLRMARCPQQPYQKYRKRKSCPLQAAFSAKINLLVVLQPFHGNMCVCSCAGGQSHSPRNVPFRRDPFALNRFRAAKPSEIGRAHSVRLEEALPKRKSCLSRQLFQQKSTYLLFFSHSIATCA